MLSARALVVLTLVLGVLQSGTTRTVYVTASAADGSALSSLEPADVTVKENGQAKRVLRVDPSRGKLHVAVVVEETLAPDNDVRRSVANFIDQIRESGALALYTVGRKTEKRVGYSSEILPFAAAINKFPIRAVERGDLVQALLEIAREQHPIEGRRAVVVVATEMAQVSSVTASAVLEQLSTGRAVLYAATLAGSETSSVPLGFTSGGRRLDLEGQVSGLERDRVFNEATRQSGGLHLSAQRTAGLWTALERFAAELQHQYLVSYDGDARSDGTVLVEANRRGITVRGPLRAR